MLSAAMGSKEVVQSERTVDVLNKFTASQLVGSVTTTPRLCT